MQEILNAMHKNGCSVCDIRNDNVYKIYITNFIDKDWGRVVLEKIDTYGNDIYYLQIYISIYY